MKEQIIKDENGNVIGFNINQNCQFIEEMKNPNNVINVNEQSMNRAYYNLLTSIYAVKLYNKGLKANRYFKITDVKKYFGFKAKDNELFLDYLQGLKDLINEE